MAYDYKSKKDNVNQLNRYMLAKTLSMFEYQGLPETIPARELEKLLQKNGYAFITKAPDGQLYAFSGGLGGETDVYGNPTKITIANTAFGLIGTALKQRFPATRLRFVEGLAGPILGWLAIGEVDMALLYSPEQSSGLNQDVLLEEDLMLVAPASWSHIGPTFPVRKLSEVPMILPSTEHGLRVLAESLMARAGARLTMALECDASNTVSMRLVEDGCGATLLPFAAVADRVAQGRLRAARLVEPVVTRKISLAMARNRPAMPELFEITQTVRKEVRELVTAGAWIGARLV